MTFPQSGLTAFVQSILNVTAAQATADFIASPTTGTLGTPQTGVGSYPLAYGSNPSILVNQAVNPVSNSYLCPNSTQPPSGSIAAEGYGAQQGNDTNPCGDISAIIPQAMIQLQNLVLQQTLYTYRM